MRAVHKTDLDDEVRSHRIGIKIDLYRLSRYQQLARLVLFGSSFKIECQVGRRRGGARIFNRAEFDGPFRQSLDLVWQRCRTEMT